jgi:hypothetical protein
MDTIDYTPEFQTSRWLGYFDLLGTSALIRSGNIDEVFSAYQDALEKLDGWRKRHPNVYHAWFSDTFIMYSDDTSGVSFSAIEMVCRWFAFSLLRRKIPLRGTLSCGHFYADRANSLYLGAALLEAYEWGENQDWIGFILCPSTVSRLNELDLPVQARLNYVEYDVPFKKAPPAGQTPVGACILGNMIRLGRTGDSVLLPKLEEMAKSQTEPSIRMKYERTIKFLVKHERRLAEESR